MTVAPLVKFVASVFHKHILFCTKKKCCHRVVFDNIDIINHLLMEIYLLAMLSVIYHNLIICFNIYIYFLLSGTPVQQAFTFRWLQITEDRVYI